MKNLNICIISSCSFYAKFVHILVMKFTNYNAGNSSLGYAACYAFYATTV